MHYYDWKLGEREGWGSGTPHPSFSSEVRLGKAYSESKWFSSRKGVLANWERIDLECTAQSISIRGNDLVNVGCLREKLLK